VSLHSVARAALYHRFGVYAASLFRVKVCTVVELGCVYIQSASASVV
jgi:hypothetical protein